VLFYVLFVSIVLFYVMFVCKCVLYYCHRVGVNPIAVEYIVSYTKNASQKGPFSKSLTVVSGDQQILPYSGEPDDSSISQRIQYTLTSHIV